MSIPRTRREDGWGWFKWSVHVHDIDWADPTAAHRGDDEGLGGGQEEGPAPTPLQKQMSFHTVVWIITLLCFSRVIDPPALCGVSAHAKWVILAGGGNKNKNSLERLLGFAFVSKFYNVEKPSRILSSGICLCGDWSMERRMLVLAKRLFDHLQLVRFLLFALVS